MKSLRFIFLIPFTYLLLSCSIKQNVPNTFVDISSYIPQLVIDLRYFGQHNFIGRPIKGYDREKLYASKEAAFALLQAQNELIKEGLGFKVFDAYRPQRAVDHFQSWAKDIADTLNKAEFYPDVDKRDLFKLGYIAAKSGHSRGSTIDLTIINLKSKEELDMGSNFDFFGEISHHNYPNISTQQKANRKKLKNIMEKHGFKAIDEEWWHYTLKNEPFKGKHFDFPIQ
ncbi:M15 family metallopeptidase [Sphingobacterium kyonggiense]